MSVNDVTSGILIPPLQLRRLQKRKPNQKIWRRSQAKKNRCVGILKRRDILFNRLHFPILIKFMLCDTSWTSAVNVFSFVAYSFKIWVRKCLKFYTEKFCLSKHVNLKVVQNLFIVMTGSLLIYWVGYSIYTQRQWKVTSKSHTFNIGQYLFHSEGITADTSRLNFMA